MLFPSFLELPPLKTISAASSAYLSTSFAASSPYSVVNLVISFTEPVPPGNTGVAVAKLSYSKEAKSKAAPI